MASDLTVVTIKTREGSEYRFPDVPRSMLKNILEKNGWGSSGQVTLVNISSACLALPARIVETLSYDGEVKWTGSPV
jgi:hypothetical protein